MDKLQRIMCADDEPDMRMLIKLCLDNAGSYEVHMCTTGKELLDQVERLSPDLIVLDAVMPLMSGPETFRQLRERESTKDIPVIFMTGKAIEAEDEFRAMGAIGFISKPFDPLNLATEIQKLWDEAKQNNAKNQSTQGSHSANML